MALPAPIRLFNHPTAPSPRRVRMMLAEKEIQVEIVDLDLERGDNITDEFKQKNPLGKVPVLELDNGMFISESRAIYHYLEDFRPDPVMMGSDALQRAEVEMWDQRCELNLFGNIGQCFQHTSGYFKDRMNPIPEWGKDCGDNAIKFIQLLEAHLADRPYLAGDFYSVADITALTSIEFARTIKFRLDDNYPNLKCWQASLRQRSSYRA